MSTCVTHVIKDLHSRDKITIEIHLHTWKPVTYLQHISYLSEHLGQICMIVLALRLCKTPAHTLPVEELKWSKEHG
jgi:hypothetical protein